MCLIRAASQSYESQKPLFICRSEAAKTMASAPTKRKRSHDSDSSSSEGLEQEADQSGTSNLSAIVEDHLQWATNEHDGNAITSERDFLEVSADRSAGAPEGYGSTSSEDEDACKNEKAEELLQRLIKVRTETDFLVESETQSNPPNSELNDSLVSNIEFNRSDYLKKELDALDGITIEADVNTMDSSINQSKARDISIDETTMDGEPLHISSTPLKQNCFSPSFSNLKESIATIPPIALDQSYAAEVMSDSGSCSSNSSDSDTETQEEPYSSSEEGSDSDTSVLDVVLSLEVDQSLNESGLETVNDSNLSDEMETFQQYFSKCSLFNELKLHSLTDVSVNESIIELMDLYLQNKLSKAGLSRTIIAMCKFLPDDHNLPTSPSEILDYVESLAPPVSATAHYFCESCLYYHGESKDGFCDICNENKFNRFFIFDLAVLIKFFFENRNLASIMDSNEQKDNGGDTNVLKDLRDGSSYKTINENRGKYDVTIMLNSDGVRIRKGCRKELWLVMFTIAEVPIHLQRSFVTVIGVWYHTKKPDMKTFLGPLVKSMEKLEQTGVEWTHPITKQIERSRVRLSVTVLDAPARAMVQNTMSFNSRYGCNVCEIKSQKAQAIPDKKTPRVYNYIEKPPLRTKARMLKQALKAQNLPPKQTNVRGVKGPSILTTIPSADVSKCVVPEYLHSVLIGVTKQLVDTWVGVPGDWCIKEKVYEIDRFLKSFKHPDFVHRQIRQLQSLKTWKASDFYYFLLFEAVPSLYGILPDKYFQHFLLLVKGIYMLLKSRITQREVNEAELLLQLFVAEFKSLYGDRSQTHNVHQLLHLALCVRRFGPLFCFSAFPYEDLNGMIAKATHGTNYVDMEIVNNIKLCQGIQVLKNTVRGLSEASSVFCYDGMFLGKDVKRSSIPSQDFDILQDSTALIYSRAKVGYDTFTSSIYKRMNSENFYVLWSDAKGTNYGEIQYFAQTKCDKLVVIKVFIVDHSRVFFHKVTRKCIEQFVPVETSNTIIAVKVSDIVSSIVKVGKINSYLYVRPNLYRFVM